MKVLKETKNIKRKDAIQKYADPIYFTGKAKIQTLQLKKKIKATQESMILSTWSLFHRLSQTYTYVHMLIYS